MFVDRFDLSVLISLMQFRVVSWNYLVYMCTIFSNIGGVNMFVTALTSVAKEKLLSTLIPVRYTTRRQEKSANKGTTQLAERALLESYTFPFWQLGICTLPKRILNRLMSALGRLRLAPQVHIFQTLGIVCLDTSHSHGQEQSDQPCQSEDILEMPLSLKYDPNVPYNLAMSCMSQALVFAKVVSIST